MSNPVPANSPIAAAAREPRAKKLWTRPAFARIDSNEAENSPNAAAGDALISSGS